MHCRHLNLYNNQLGDNGAAVLSYALSKLAVVNHMHINVGMNQIQEALFLFLGTVFSLTGQLDVFHLVLCYNPLD